MLYLIGPLVFWRVLAYLAVFHFVRQQYGFMAVYARGDGRAKWERIWDEVKIMIADGNAVMAWAAPTDSGFEFEAIGANRREPVDFDGLTLVKFLPPTPAPQATTPAKKV